MNQPYYAILTATGEHKLTQASALAQPLQLTHMAVGDGHGTTPQQARDYTQLLNEQHRAPLNSLFLDPELPNQFIAEQILPEAVGGFWIRELGLFDADGDLIAVACCPDTYKPLLSSGSGRTLVLRMVLFVTGSDAVELMIDPSVVLATHEYVDQLLVKHEQAVNPHPQYMLSPTGIQAGSYTKLTVDEMGRAIAGSNPCTLADYGITDGATVDQIAQAVPAGAVMFFAMGSAPDGWLKANGAEISRTAYAALFAAIGTVFGVGDGSITFNVPDLRGEFLRGFGDGRGVDSNRAFGTGQSDAFQGHYHYNGYLSSKPYAGGSTSGDFLSVGPNVASNGVLQPTPDGTNGTPRTAAETRPRNIALLACIKY